MQVCAIHCMMSVCHAVYLDMWCDGAAANFSWSIADFFFVLMWDDLCEKWH